MRRRTREAFDIFAAKLDELEAQCIEVERKIQAEEPTTVNERAQLARWLSEGRPLWRNNPQTIARLRRTARRCARRARGKV